MPQVALSVSKSKYYSPTLDVYNSHKKILGGEKKQIRYSPKTTRNIY